MEFVTDRPMFFLAVAIVLYVALDFFKGKPWGKTKDNASGGGAGNGALPQLLKLVRRWGHSELYGGLIEQFLSGDARGIEAEAANTVTQLNDDTRALPAMDENFEMQLKQRAADPVQRQKILDVLGLEEEE